MGRDYLTGPTQNEGIAFMIPSQASSGFAFQRYGANVLEESFDLQSDQLIEKFTTTTTTTTTTTSKTATVGQTIGLTVGNVLDEMMDLDLFNSDFDSRIGVKFSYSLGKVKTDLTWLDLEISEDVNFTFQQQRRLLHLFNAVYCIFMVVLLGPGSLLFNHL